MNKTLTVVVSAWLSCSTAPSLAHHSFAAQYDADNPVTLVGVVTKVEWLNPHARFYVDVADEDGNVVNWNLELASPNILRRNGWTRNFVEIGDQVIVEGSLARDGTRMANALSVSLADGTRIITRD